MKLICINDVTDILGFGDGVKELTYGKSYEITRYYKILRDGRRYISLINDKNIDNDYLIDRFISLSEYRENKLKKLGIL